MINVSAQQFALLEASAQQQHARNLARALAGSYPAAMSGNEDTDTEYVLRAMADASAFGIQPMDDVNDFVEATVLMGEGFVHREDLPWAGAVARDTRTEKGRRLLELAHIVRATAPHHAG